MEDNIPSEQIQETDSLEGKPVSQAIRDKKYSWYDKVPFTVRQMDIIIGIAVAGLIIVFILIILEAAGIFKL